MDETIVTLYQRINKLWRIFATAFCFSLFGLGGLTLTFIIFPLLTFSIKEVSQRELQVQKIIQRAFSLFCDTMRFLGALDYRIEGAEKLQLDKNCLLIANHPSLIDYVLIASRLKQCDCLVKAAIWHNPFMKGVVKSAGYIPNNGAQELIEHCAKRLNDGNVLLIFPEGTRTTPGKHSVLQRGAAQIAIKTATDIRMIHIHVSPPFLTKETKWYQVPDIKPFFHVQVKDKLSIQPFIDSHLPPSVAVRNLNRHLSDLFPPDHT
ncbi:lysophospholipid acyltransferase family protein [Psychromonas sp. MME2]|uniref:lysophospholipid acyltransferase family protein n=1 Tax=Psychromonas sp. MME2 TaxID=3231033 RepID=UPI00339BFB28